MTALMSGLELAHIAFLHSWNAEIFAAITGLSGHSYWVVCGAENMTKGKTVGH